MTLYVPKGAVDTYKKAISDIYMYRDDSYVWKDEGGTTGIMEQPQENNNITHFKEKE